MQDEAQCGDEPAGQAMVSERVMAEQAGGNVLQEALKVLATIDHDVCDEGERRVQNRGDRAGDESTLQDAPIDGES